MRISDWSSDVCSSDLGPVQTGFVALLQPRDDAAVLLLDLLRQPDRDHRRHEGEREDEGEGERDDDGERHRHERLALHAGQRQQRHIDKDDDRLPVHRGTDRSEEHTSELQSLMRISYAVFCLKKKTTNSNRHTYIIIALTQ